VKLLQAIATHFEQVEQGWIGQGAEIYPRQSATTGIELLDGLEVRLGNRPGQAHANGPVERGALPGIDGVAPCHWFDSDWNVRVQPALGAGIFRSPPGVSQF
jgi:hypothetical protein